VNDESFDVCLFPAPQTERRKCISDQFKMNCRTTLHNCGYRLVVKGKVRIPEEVISDVMNDNSSHGS
jgi:hypothetical protein